MVKTLRVAFYLSCGYIHEFLASLHSCIDPDERPGSTQAGVTCSDVTCVKRHSSSSVVAVSLSTCSCCQDISLPSRVVVAFFMVLLPFCEYIFNQRYGKNYYSVKSIIQKSCQDSAIPLLSPFNGYAFLRILRYILNCNT